MRYLKAEQEAFRNEQLEAIAIPSSSDQQQASETEDYEEQAKLHFEYDQPTSAADIQQ
ncbi:MAG: hypothetical protein KME08_07845 [Aphanothece sp. CMT-3BRIN-NPC111]|nr:hypothetical protein [Aphanothece sp. CMT-3BRIN-NPC111]